MRRIRNAIKSVSHEVKMNQEIFVAHLVVLILYLVSVVLFQIAWTEGTLNSTSQGYLILMYRLWDTSTYFSFLQQLFLIVLFWSLAGDTKPSVVSEDFNGPVDEVPNLEKLGVEEAQPVQIDD